MPAESVIALAKAIDIITRVHTQDATNAITGNGGFSIEWSPGILWRQGVDPQEYVKAWETLRRAIGKQVADE